MSKKHPTVSIIFPTLNSKKLLSSFFASLDNQTYPQDKLEMVFVDNGSKDGTPEFIKKNFPQVKLIELNQNIGFAPALNVATKKSTGEIIFVTNDDATFNKDCIKELVLLLTSNPQIGMVSGKLLYMDPPGLLAWPGFRLNPYLGYHPYDTSRLDQVRESDWFSGPAMMIKKNVLKAAGLFDEGYFFCGEDYDLSLTIKELGYKIMYTPKAIIHHGFRRSGRKKGGNLQSLYNHFRGKFRCVLKNATPLQMLTYFPIQLLIIPPYRLFTTNPQNFLLLLKAQSKALFWNIRNLKHSLAARRKKKARIKSYLSKMGVMGR